MQRYYIKTSRHLKRLEAINLSPIYIHFVESVQGISTIKAFNRQKQFQMESLKRIDNHQRAYYSMAMAIRYVEPVIT